MKKAYFGPYGGQFVPELLLPPLQELEKACESILPSPVFQNELGNLLRTFAGRPTSLTLCENLTRELGFSLWLKREDLLHTGAHKMNNTIGQVLLAKYMGKTSILAETGAGQHGVATAAAAARLGMECTVFMGAKDVRRQAPNVSRMRLLGAQVIAVDSGSQTLKDAINAALRFWITHQKTTHYCFGTAAGPHPFPTLVRNLQQVIGHETKAAFETQTGQLPDVVVACVGGGSNAIGMFYPFIADPKASSVRLIGIEAGGTGEPNSHHSAPINLGTPGVLHGQYSLLLQDGDGQIQPSASISAGLDYPSVGAEHAYLHSIGRVKYHVVYDKAALKAFSKLSRSEGIIPALESSHALAWVLDNAGSLGSTKHVVVNLSGRGDKDLGVIQEHTNLLFGDAS